MPVCFWKNTNKDNYILAAGGEIRYVSLKDTSTTLTKKNRQLFMSPKEQERQLNNEGMYEEEIRNFLLMRVIPQFSTYFPAWQLFLKPTLMY